MNKMSVTVARVYIYTHTGNLIENKISMLNALLMIEEKDR